MTKTAIGRSVAAVSERPGPAAVESTGRDLSRRNGCGASWPPRLLPKNRTACRL